MRDGGVYDAFLRVRWINIVWNFLADNNLQINSRDKSRDASHTTFKNVSEKILSKLANNKCASIVS